MSFFKVKLLICIVFFTIPIVIYSNSFIGVNSKPPITSQIEGTGIIVMDDIIMAVTVNDSQDPIHEVVVLSRDTSVFQANGCGSNYCTFNLSELEAGSYTVIVYTEQGDSFSAPILV